MAPQFCDDCGNILNETTDQTVKCDCCGKLNNSTTSDTGTTSTHQFDSKLRKTHVQNLTEAEKSAASKQKISEECPQCGSTEMHYSEIQLRSADEGTTIFYSCPKCNHKFMDNN